MTRSSVRQDPLQRTQRWRDQLRDMGDRAGDRLEGWLEELWTSPRRHRPRSLPSPVLEVWDDDDWPIVPVSGMRSLGLIPLSATLGTAFVVLGVSLHTTSTRL